MNKGNLEKGIERAGDYNPYKVVVESIAEMCEKYAAWDSNLQDFYDNVKVKCKDAKEYDEVMSAKVVSQPKQEWNEEEEKAEDDPGEGSDGSGGE